MGPLVFGSRETVRWKKFLELTMLDLVVEESVFLWSMI
jgi:hypothetical protein